jgi:hypothetical protein
MKLKANSATGLVAVEATSDTSFHVTGDVWGETPTRAALLIDRGLVKEATLPDDIETVDVDTDAPADAAAPAAGGEEKKTRKPRAPKGEGEKTDAPADAGGADDGGAGGGNGTGGDSA